MKDARGLDGHSQTFYEHLGGETEMIVSKVNKKNKTMKKLIIACLLIVCVCSCECEDQQRLNSYLIELGKVKDQIDQVSETLSHVSFEDDPFTYFIIEESLIDLVIKSAVIELDIDNLKKTSKCL